MTRRMLQQFNKIAERYPRTAKFIVETLRKHPGGGIEIYIPQERISATRPEKVRRRVAVSRGKGFQ